MPIIFSSSLLALPASAARFTGLAFLKDAAVAFYPTGMQFNTQKVSLTPSVCVTCNIQMSSKNAVLSSGLFNVALYLKVFDYVNLLSYIWFYCN